MIATLLLIAGLSYGRGADSAPADVADEKTAINETLDKFDEALLAQDVSGLTSLLCEEGMVIGTDPSEFWNKQEITDLWTEALVQGPPEFKYLGDREIVIAPGGKAAVVVTQYMIPAWSPNIPWRQVYHMVKMKKEWKILVINIAFVPKNEHIQAINAALD